MYHYENTLLVDIRGEEWIDVVGYDGIYQVSNMGRIKSMFRYVLGKNGREFPVKEKIRKQTYSEKHSSLRVFLCCDGKSIPFIVSRLMFFSFNYNVENLPEYFVIHKDNDPRHNMLNNLKIGTRKEVSRLTFDAGKQEYLKLGNPIPSKHVRDTSTIVDGVILDKVCTACGERLSLDAFKPQHNRCKKCDEIYYFRSIGSDRKKGFKVKMTFVNEGRHIIFDNFNDNRLAKIMSIPTAIKYADSGEIYTPYFNSRNKDASPCIIERVMKI